MLCFSGARENGPRLFFANDAKRGQGAIAVCRDGVQAHVSDAKKMDLGWEKNVPSSDKIKTHQQLREGRASFRVCFTRCCFRFSCAPHHHISAHHASGNTWAFSLPSPGRKFCERVCETTHLDMGVCVCAEVEIAKLLLYRGLCGSECVCRLLIEMRSL